jgi:hypothetical protein
MLASTIPRSPSTCRRLERRVRVVTPYPTASGAALAVAPTYRLATAAAASSISAISAVPPPHPSPRLASSAVANPIATITLTLYALAASGPALEIALCLASHAPVDALSTRSADAPRTPSAPPSPASRVSPARGRAGRRFATFAPAPAVARASVSHHCRGAECARRERRVDASSVQADQHVRAQ